MAVDLAARLLPRSSSSHPRAGARVRFSRTSAEGTPITVRAVVRSGRLGAAESSEACLLYTSPSPRDA